MTRGFNLTHMVGASLDEWLSTQTSNRVDQSIQDSGDLQSSNFGSDEETPLLGRKTVKVKTEGKNGENLGAVYEWHGFPRVEDLAAAEEGELRRLGTEIRIF